MGEYAFYSLQDEELLKLGVETLPLPVSREREEEVFGGEKVRVDLILEELLLFLNEYPELRNVYAGTMESLAYLAGVGLGMEGDPGAAARFLEMGLQARPESLLLRSSYALVLQLQGQGEEALEQYEIVLADPEGEANPIVNLLAARLYAEQEMYLQAYRLLEPMAGDLPADDVFWDFLAEMKELAGVGEEGEAETPAAFCTSCGEPVKEGKAFCNKCGKPVDGLKKQARAFCTGCGKPLQESKAFCTGCGKPV